MRLSERIKQKHTDLKLWQALKDLIGWPFYGIGWLIGKAWWLVIYITEAWVIGFTDGKAWKKDQQ